MKYIDFDESRELDLIPIGRVESTSTRRTTTTHLISAKTTRNMSAVLLPTSL